LSASSATISRVLLWDLYNEPGNRGIFATGTQEVQYDAKLETCARADEAGVPVGA
jgi:hypothetical protein